MEKLKTIDVQGKPYVTVNERLKYFRDQYPKYSLRTNLVLVDETQALIKAEIRDEQDRIVAEGTAFETAGSSFINRTSHVENAETSAWGRALGNFGIGIDESVASAQEVANAVLNKDKVKKAPKVEDSTASSALIETIRGYAKELQMDEQAIWDKFNGGSPIVSSKLAQNIIVALKAKKQQLAKELDAAASQD
jgi:hypothetical protein